jgi:hypothetical protein
MEYKQYLKDAFYSYYKVLLCLFYISYVNKIKVVESAFYTGKTDHSINEMDRLNGRMTPREAAIKCELEDECAGFTYHGPKTLWDVHQFQVTFY